MVSFRSLLAVMPLLSLAAAQVKIAFTSVPAVVVVGQSYNITWGGGDGSPATLTLRQGPDPSNLSTVAVLQDNIDGDWWVWKVPDNLPTSADYALQITQGLVGINYSGFFALVGGTGSSSISYSGYTTTTANGTITQTGTPIITSSLVMNTGTGVPMPRNTTFSSATLSGTATFGATGSATRTATTTTASSSGGASQVGSSAALVMGIVAAIMCLH